MMSYEAFSKKVAQAASQIEAKRSFTRKIAVRTREVLHHYGFPENAVIIAPLGATEGAYDLTLLDTAGRPNSHGFAAIYRDPSHDGAFRTSAISVEVTVSFREGFGHISVGGKEINNLMITDEYTRDFSQPTADAIIAAWADEAKSLGKRL